MEGKRGFSKEHRKNYPSKTEKRKLNNFEKACVACHIAIRSGAIIKFSEQHKLTSTKQ